MPLQGKSGYRILIADDNALDLKLMEGFAESFGWSFISASDGASAKRFAAEWEFDAIVLDQYMSTFSGLDLLAWLRQSSGKNAETPVLIWTAGDHFTLQQAARGLDAVTVVPKPFYYRSFKAWIGGSVDFCDDQNVRRLY